MVRDFKLEDLRIDPADLPAKLSPSATPANPTPAGGRRLHKRNFAQITDAQIHRMVGASAAAWMTFVYLVQQNWQPGKPIKLANAALKMRGVNRRAKWRALDELERRGNIQAKRLPRKSPEITILD